MIYNLILRLRHLFYDRGWKKSFPAELPSVCVGNVAAGGTGKTPMTELIIRTLQEGEVEAADSEIYGFSGVQEDFRPRKIAVLSRGYKRKTRGFRQVTEDGTAAEYGDEPLQIKRKFPDVTVVVDEDRCEGMRFLAHPEAMAELKSRKKARIADPVLQRPETVILDDAFQYRRLVPSGSMVLTTYDRPYTDDRLLPWGRLRDLRSRAEAADIIVVTKCPLYLDESGKSEFAGKLGLKDYDPVSCSALTSKGRRIGLLFAAMVYDRMQPVFPEGDPHYIHAKMALAVSGIADSAAFLGHVGDLYKLMAYKEFPDHHNYSRSDIRSLETFARSNPLAVIVTTEKDAQRLKDSDVPQELRRRLFYIPVRTLMLASAEQRTLKEFLLHL